MAECLVEQGRAGEGLTHVNRVRARAGLNALPTLTVESLAHERRLELAFENHRWFDLLRTGKAIEVMTEYGKYIKTVDSFSDKTAYTIKPEYLIFPIPHREMYTNSKLTQNPGY